MTELDRLLRRIRDGETAPDVLERARALLRLDTRLPEELREIGLDDEDPDIAAGALLGVLGLDDGLFGGLLGEALRSEAGAFDAPAAPAPRPDFSVQIPATEAPEPGPPPRLEAPVTEDMLAAQEAEGLPPVAAAVRAEAGEVELAVAVLCAMGVEVVDIGSAISELAGEIDLAGAVSARLGDLPAPLEDAVAHEAGDADLAASIVAPLGDPLWPVAAAVRAEAGEVELSVEVLTAVAELAAADVARAVRAEAGEIDIAAAVVPSELDVAAAVRAEAGEIDLASAVLTAIGITEETPVADAVRDEAGDAIIWDGLSGAFEEGWVAGLLDRELATAAHRIAARRLMTDPVAGAELAAFADQGRMLRTELRAEAGETPYLWVAVANRIGIEDPEAVPGWDGALVAEAVRAMAGPCAIEKGVMRRIEDRRAVPDLDAPLSTPAPANNTRRWQWAGLALAATVLISVVAARLVPSDMFDGLGGDRTANHVAEQVDFATAGEVTVEELSYDEDVEVIMTLPDESGDRPLIIRINEEA